MYICEKVCNSKRWAFTTSVCIVLLLGVGSYIVYEKFIIFGRQNSKAAILQKYGSILFFSEEQIEKMNLTGNTGRSIANKTEKIGKSCSFTCTNSLASLARDSHYSNPKGADESKTENSRGSTKKANDRDIGDATTGSGEGLHSNTSTITTASSVNTTAAEGNYTMPKLDRTLSSQSRSERYHGCCVSRTRVVAPQTLQAADGRTMRIVQFEDQRQIYVEDQCRQVESCTGCTCHKEFRQMLFLVKENNDDGTNEERMRVEMMVVPACCKCINDGSGR